LQKAQKEAIGFNLGLLLLHMNKVEECKTLVAQLRSEFPNNDLLPLVSASILIRENKVDESKQLLEDYASKHPESSTRTSLSIAQMYLNQGNIPAVLKTLESIENLRNSPAVICSLISLGESVGNSETVLQALDTGVKTLSKQADYYPNLLRKTANFKLKFGKYQDAAKIYKQLLELVQSSNSSEKSTEVEIMTLLAISYSHFDPATAKKYALKIAEISGVKDSGGGKDSEEYATELEKLAVPVFKKKEKKRGIKYNNNIYKYINHYKNCVFAFFKNGTYRY